MEPKFPKNIASEVQIITRPGTRYVTLDTLEECIDAKRLLSLKNGRFETLISEVIQYSGKSDSENYYSSKFKEFRRKLTSRKAGLKCQIKKINEREQEIAEIEILQRIKLILSAEKRKLYNEIVLIQIQMQQVN